MTIYEENLKALSAKYSRMDELIEEAKEKMEPELEIIEEVSYDEEPIIKVQKEGKTCYLNGKRNTKEPAEKWVETLGKLPNNAPVFIMGLGNPSYLKELAEHTKKKITIIIYEPSFQIFLHFLEHVSIAEWMEKHMITFFVKGIKGMDEQAMRGMAGRVLTYESIPFSRRLVLPNYDVLFPDEVLGFVKVMFDIADFELSQYSTQISFSTVTVKNMLDNIKYLCNGYKTIQLVEVIPRDIPGILVSAGPSLNKNIKELKRAKGKAFIIAVDTAIKPLLSEGIIPDMFAVVDGRKPLSLVEKEEAKEIPLLGTLSASSAVLEYHTGMKFFYNEGYAVSDHILLKQDMDFGSVETGGSVATTAFSLLYKIGLPCIILVGQDLAYTGDKSHADGTFADVMKKEDTKNYITVEGNTEEKVPTTEILKLYLKWFGDYIAAAKKYDPNFRVINATEGGAKIEHTEIMTLHDAIEQECTKEVDIQACLKKLPPMLNEENRKWAEEYLDSFPDKFLEVAKSANKTRKLYKKLEQTCKRKNIDTKEYQSLLKKIEKSIKQIEKNEMHQLIDATMINARYILAREQFLYRDSLQEEGKELARQGLIYTENMAKIAILFKEYLEEKKREEKKSMEGNAC